jgi:hypothetical protein
MKNRMLMRVVVLGFSLFIGISAWADGITSFSNRNSFDSAIAPAPGNFFDSFAPGTVIPEGSTQLGVTFGLSNASANFHITTGGLALPGAPNSLEQIVGGVTNAFLPGDVITFTFASPIDAFGISFNAFSTSNGVFSLTTNLGDVVLSAYDPFPGADTGHFLGFTSETLLSSVTITETVGPNVAYGLNDMQFISPQISTPEPSALMLVGTGGFAIGALFWRLKKPRDG